MRSYVSTASMDGSLKMWNAPTSFLPQQVKYLENNFNSFESTEIDLDSL